VDLCPAENLSILEEFERPISTVPMKQLEWSVEKHEVAQLLSTKGMSIEKVSEITNVPISAIKKWKTHPDFIKYMNDYILSIAESMKAYRLSLYLKIIDARVDKIEAMDNYSMLSTKDTLDILEAMRKETEKEDNKEQSQYLKTLEVLLSKSPNVVEITHRRDTDD
jgi:hypothetical protein